jgi:hypothetical protein
MKLLDTIVNVLLIEQKDRIAKIPIKKIFFILLSCFQMLLLNFEGDLKLPSYQNRYCLKFRFIIKLSVPSLEI